jgi:hypothetical protein
MKNEYEPIGDMSYQEWRSEIDRKEDADIGQLILSFRDPLVDLKALVISYYTEILRRGDRNLNKEYLDFFNISTEKK